MLVFEVLSKCKSLQNICKKILKVIPTKVKDKLIR